MKFGQSCEGIQTFKCWVFANYVLKGFFIFYTLKGFLVFELFCPFIFGFLHMVFLEGKEGLKTLIQHI